jgi:hypothetical protein
MRKALANLLLLLLLLLLLHGSQNNASLEKS